MTAPKGGPNEAAARRVVSSLRRQDRLDEVGSAIAVLACTTAKLVDQAAADAEVAQYAKARTAVCYLSVLAELRSAVGGGQAVENDPFNELLVNMAAATSGEFQRAQFHRQHGHDPPGWPPT